MKLLIENDKLILNNNNKYIKFSCSDENFINAVKAYYERFDIKEAKFSVRTPLSGQHVVIFSSGYQILVSPAVSFELTNRMILLNDKLKQSIINDEE